MWAGAKQTYTRLKTCVLQSEKNDYVMHEMYRKEDVHVMPTSLPHQLGSSTELEQASLPAELYRASYSQRQTLCPKMKSLSNVVAFIKKSPFCLCSTLLIFIECCCVYVEQMFAFAFHCIPIPCISCVCVFFVSFQESICGRG